MEFMRILLSENCNANCSYCFNKDIREKKEMNSTKTKQLINYLHENKVHILKIMGGEPTLHTNFVEIYKYAQSKIPLVILFTNAINKEILKIKPRENEAIAYNFLFINKDFDFNKLLPKYKFSRGFEFAISSYIDVTETINKIDLTLSKIKELNIQGNITFNLTLDCTENIFENRKIIAKKYLDIFKYIKQINPKLISFDHNMPRCFWTKELRNEPLLLSKTGKGICGENCQGLINSDFQIAHCNQLPAFGENIFKTVNGKEEIIQFKELQKILHNSHTKKLNFVHDTNCKNCKEFLKTCNGGCMMHKFDNRGNLIPMNHIYLKKFI